VRDPGRSCPPHYGYAPQVFARAADFRAATLYVVDGPAFSVAHALGRKTIRCSV